jgi:hypothetical protein
MSMYEPETLQEKFEEELRNAAYEADFCPCSEWIRKVSNRLMKTFDIQEKDWNNKNVRV